MTPAADTASRKKNLLSRCFDSKANISSQSSNPYQEINDYLAADFSQSFPDDDVSDDIDILSFWRAKQHLFPTLAKLAKLICSIPASNTIIERLFSTAKNVVTEKRTSLDCDKINHLLFSQKKPENFETSIK